MFLNSIQHAEGKWLPIAFHAATYIIVPYLLGSPLSLFITLNFHSHNPGFVDYILNVSTISTYDFS